MTVTGFGEIAEQLRRSTVLIQSGGRGAGSGVIWSSDGLILTNAHVVRAQRMNLQLWDGREFNAAVLQRDPQRDLAALRIETNGLPEVQIADSSLVQPGELAIAIGNPMGFVGALTTGVVQAVGPLRGLGAHPWVQASVRLAPGNSGGPLADARGRVIGINTMVAGRLALAVPSNDVRDFLVNPAQREWLGIAVFPVRLPPESSQRFGLLLQEVTPGLPAALASLMAGDILLGTEERAFQDVGDLFGVIGGQGPRLLRLRFLRGNYHQVRRVTLRLEEAKNGRDQVAA